MELETYPNLPQPICFKKLNSNFTDNNYFRHMLVILQRAMAEEDYGKMKETARRGRLLVATGKCSKEAGDGQ